jgi:glycosyltransferase A (GT-A) superfamily protein (DUF2064 family)
VAGAVVLVRAPAAEGVLSGLADVLDAAARARLQASLVRRAAAWAKGVAPGHAVVAVEPGGSVEEVTALAGDVVVETQGNGTRGERIAAAVQRAFDRWGGPVMIAGTDVPRLSAGHAAAALADLEGGGEASFGPSMDGGWYLAALAAPRLELFDLAAEVWDGPVVMARMLETAQRLGLETGLLRMERALRTPGDLAAMAADPLTPSDVFASLPAGMLRNAQWGRGSRSPGTQDADR